MTRARLSDCWLYAKVKVQVDNHCCFWSVSVTSTSKKFNEQLSQTDGQYDYFDWQPLIQRSTRHEARTTRSIIFSVVAVVNSSHDSGDNTIAAVMASNVAESSHGLIVCIAYSFNLPPLLRMPNIHFRPTNGDCQMLITAFAEILF